MHKPPSQQLHDLLSGKAAWADTSQSVQSWARLEIHRAAVEVLRLHKEERDAFLERIPSSLQDMVKAEANRVWRYRRDNP